MRKLDSSRGGDSALEGLAGFFHQDNERTRGKLRDEKGDYPTTLAGLVAQFRSGVCRTRRWRLLKIVA
jgi:hypothetical protein